MIAVIIPCYKSRKHILNVLSQIDDEVTEIILVDDACPESTVDYAREHCNDPRLKFVYHDTNMGVGAAMKSGFREALKGEAQVFVKLDSDEQMDPSIMSSFYKPILTGESDCCKGNRFYNLESLKDMPISRLLGNSLLSFFSKLSCGYWHVMDPTNGYLAVHRNVITHMPLNKLDDRYFFETDLLFRLNTMGAVITDIPMDAVYADETSHLSITRSIVPFFVKNIKAFFKRIFYNYFLRDFSVASLNLVLGLVLFVFGILYGLKNYLHFNNLGIQTPTGVQVITAIMIIIGFQLLLAFITHDMSRVPTRPIYRRLSTHVPQVSASSRENSDEQG